MSGKMNDFFEEMYKDAASEAMVHAAPSPKAATKVLMALALILALFLFFVFAVPCKGIFPSGIDYSGHGFLGWAALFLSSACMATMVSVFVLWLFRGLPRRKPEWKYFAFAIVFMVLFVVGISRHVPDPIIGEVGCGACTVMALYLSFFCRKSKDIQGKNDNFTSDNREEL